MTQPTATIEIPSRSQILDVFKGLSEQAFESSAQALRNVDFYGGVLRSLDKGYSILDQVPEAAGMMPDAVQTQPDPLLAPQEPARRPDGRQAGSRTVHNST